MTEVETSRRCLRCGTVVSQSALGGQCPRCVAKVLRQTVGGEANQAPPAGIGPPTTREPAPRYFGDYELMSELGRGGMGIVYRARQFSLNRTVALKLIAIERLNSPKDVERFHAEAEVTGHLDYPNIVPVYEIGEIEGRHYFTMKLIEGQTLAQRISTPGGLDALSLGSSVAAAALVAKVADAVHYAHQRGVLHRDLKPANLLIDDNGDPHVTDFGLAKYFESERNLSLSGEVLGTPAYMAPEQAMGKTRQVTTSVDVYSLGAILYELLAGHPPFRGETPVQILEAVLHDEPVSPRLLKPTISRDLETITLRCLEKEPTKRYPTAQAVAEELRRFVQGEPIQARPVTRVGRGWRWCRRNPAFASALAGLALAAIAGLAGILWEWQRARINAAESREAELTARANLYAADINLVQRALAADNLRQAHDLLQRCIPEGNEPDLRGFEWRYFWQQSRGEELYSLPGFQHAVNCVAFSPDGSTLAAGGFDCKILVWAPRSHRLVALLPHSDPVMGVAFSPRGDLLATATKSTVRLWSTTGYQALRELGQAAGKLVFSPDGNYLVPASASGRILWDTGAWRVVRTWHRSGLWPGESDGVGYGLAFSPDGSRIGLALNEGIKIFSVPDLREMAMLTNRMPPFRFVAFSPDGHTLAASTAGYRVTLWDLGIGREIRSLPGHSDSVFGGRFSPNGERLATCSADQTLKRWDITTGELIRTFKGHKDEVWDVMFSPNGRLLASVGKDGAVKIWDAERKPCQDTVLRGVDSLGFNSDGCLIASSINSGMLAYNPKSLQLLSAQEYSDLGARSRYEPFLGNLFSDGHTAGLFVPAERKIELWDLRTHQLLCSVGSLERSVAFAPKSRLLATVTSNQTVTVWQLPGGWRRWLLTNSTPPLAFSPDGAMLVTEAEPGRSLRAWKIGGNTVRPETILYGQGMHQCSLAWSPDGRLLAVGTWEGTVCLLAMPAGRQVGVLVGHKRAVSSLAFSPDGKTLATISSDRTLRLWHIATHRELATFDERREDLVTTVSLSFSPDGSALAAERTWADGKGTRLWYAPSLAQIADAEAEPDSPWLGSGRSPSASRNHGDGKMSPSGKKTSAGL